MSEYRLVYITTSSEAEAHRIGRNLVEQRLAACANIIPGMRSVYRWKGEICEDNEVVLLAKTTAAKLADLTESVLQQHSYECPCIVAIPLEAGNPAYLTWIGESVAQ